MSAPELPIPSTSKACDDLIHDVPPPSDIGLLLDPTKSIEEICEVVGQLSNDQNILHFIIMFPQLMSIQAHLFTALVIPGLFWLIYSHKLEAIFCGPCSILLPVSERRDKGLLVNRPFSNWGKLSTTLISHSEHTYHRECLQDADILKSVTENPTCHLDVMTSSILQDHIKENKHILRQIVCAIIYLGK